MQRNDSLPEAIEFLINKTAHNKLQKSERKSIKNSLVHCHIIVIYTLVNP